MHKSADPRVIIGPGDDAGIYLFKEGAIVETVDIITPIVDDPYTFGAISAANSMSDVYAMGGTPVTALAILGFSSCDFSPDENEIARKIIHESIGLIRYSSAS